MNKRLLAVPALGALLAFGAVGCGGDDSAQLNAWATTVCDSAKDPIAQAQAALADTAQVKEGEVPADLQKRLSDDVARLARTNQQIAEAIDKAGAPKVDNGGGLQKDAVDELNKAAQGYLEVQKKLDGLPNADQAKFADGLRSVGDQVQQLATLSTQAQNKLQSGDLGAAMARQPGCKPGAPAAAPSAAAPSGAPAGASAPATPGASGAPAASGDPAASPSAPAADATGSAAPSASAAATSPAASPS
ncbi:small secreted protein [Kitasatospora sp. NBC_00240]|uniref:small secreted protein n=1 Tax=Kitasatospora sp. NBC_00240 TaxID=2903567 RepID=UPI00224F1B79|nr:small secreted protein [Kitasatospora sp. NBC_00240]MCX5212054.1 small secreted protein [Kitasatospora sp. NBC_00240]